MQRTTPLPTTLLLPLRPPLRTLAKRRKDPCNNGRCNTVIGSDRLGVNGC